MYTSWPVDSRESAHCSRVLPSRWPWTKHILSTQYQNIARDEVSNDNYKNHLWFYVICRSGYLRLPMKQRRTTQECWLSGPEAVPVHFPGPTFHQGTPPVSQDLNRKNNPSNDWLIIANFEFIKFMSSSSERPAKRVRQACEPCRYSHLQPVAQMNKI
jgi:hypothetical protein